MNLITALLFISCAPKTQKNYDLFEIIENDSTAASLEEFDRKVEVFGLYVYAESGVSDEKLLHVSSIWAELLDNDEDGNVDDEALLAELQAQEALMPIFNREGSRAEEALMDNYDGNGISAVLYDKEVDPDNIGVWPHDASVEELLHTINHVGHVAIYPEAFAIEPSSSLLSEALDEARGGQFEEVPSEYPSDSWFHYDDETCDYGCMAIEYLYWSIATHMGLINDDDVCEGISNEWELCTPEDLEETDVKIHSLITDSQYLLPQNAPDGEYLPN